MAVTEIAVVFNADMDMSEIVCWLDSDHTRCDRLAWIDEDAGTIEWYPDAEITPGEREWVAAYARVWELCVSDPPVPATHQAEGASDGNG